MILQIPKISLKEDEKIKVQYYQNFEGTREELLNKKAWFGRLLKKTTKINHFEKSKFLIKSYHLAFACLENLTLPYRHPCMMDLKMGSLAYNPKKS